jgi:LPXTG-site transpeptidase (sortase) family protein
VATAPATWSFPPSSGAPGSTKPATAKPPARTSSPRQARQAVRPAAPVGLTVRSSAGRVLLQVAVDPMAAPINTDGTWGLVRPPNLNRVVWLTQSTLPASPSPGTTAIYGHACQGITCAFDALVDVEAGDTVILTTGAGVLTYRINALIKYPKSGPGSLASKRSVPNELMLVTCAYQPDSSSLDNLVATGTLITSRKL